jgi:small-conductance mechanosensitive channel
MDEITVTVTNTLVTAPMTVTRYIIEDGAGHITVVTATISMGDLLVFAALVLLFVYLLAGFIRSWLR